MARRRGARWGYLCHSTCCAPLVPGEQAGAASICPEMATGQGGKGWLYLISIPLGLWLFVRVWPEAWGPSYRGRSGGFPAPFLPQWRGPGASTF